MEEKVDLWFCVGSDGREYVCNEKPQRISEYIKSMLVSSSYLERHKDKIPPDDWFTNTEYTDYGFCGVEFSLYAIELPKGTIEFLFGDPRSWEDDPVLFNYGYEKS